MTLIHSVLRLLCEHYLDVLLGVNGRKEAVKRRESCNTEECKARWPSATAGRHQGGAEIWRTATGFFGHQEIPVQHRAYQDEKEISHVPTTNGVHFGRRTDLEYKRTTN